MRYRGYVDALDAHQIPLDPRLITPHYGWPSDWRQGGREAMNVLLDERKLRPGIDFDAMIGSNDASAVSVMETLRERGIRVPFDVAVVGFDDQVYGIDRLCGVISRHYDQSAEAIKQAVIDDVTRFIGQHKVYDDLTLVVIKQK